MSVFNIDGETRNYSSTAKIIFRAFLSTKRPTVCTFPERRATGYYCIRAGGHRGHHRYGMVVHGDFRARSPQPARVG